LWNTDNDEGFQRPAADRTESAADEHGTGLFTCTATKKIGELYYGRRGSTTIAE
jgi:hypothetical protein